jgi:hypothetical protein
MSDLRQRLQVIYGNNTHYSKSTVKVKINLCYVPGIPPADYFTGPNYFANMKIFLIKCHAGLPRLSLQGNGHK